MQKQNIIRLTIVFIRDMFLIAAVSSLTRLLLSIFSREELA